MKNEQVKKRMAARLAAVQSIYAAQICNDNDPQGQAAFTDEEGHQAETDTILRDIIISDANREKIKYDAMIDAHLSNRQPKSLELLLRLIMRCGCAELFRCQETDVAVVISAYVDITKEFYDKKEAGLVNAVLDKIAKSVT